MMGKKTTVVEAVARDNGTPLRGTLFTLANAVKNGADIFGSYSEGLQ
jgi:hypothetical protein